MPLPSKITNVSGTSKEPVVFDAHTAGRIERVVTAVERYAGNHHHGRVDAPPWDFVGEESAVVMPFSISISGLTATVQGGAIHFIGTTSYGDFIHQHDDAFALTLSDNALNYIWIELGGSSMLPPLALADLTVKCGAAWPTTKWYFKLAVIYIVSGEVHWGSSNICWDGGDIIMSALLQVTVKNAAGSPNFYYDVYYQDAKICSGSSLGKPTYGWKFMGVPYTEASDNTAGLATYVSNNVWQLLFAWGEKPIVSTAGVMGDDGVTPVTLTFVGTAA